MATQQLEKKPRRRRPTRVWPRLAEWPNQPLEAPSFECTAWQVTRNHQNEDGSWDLRVEPAGRVRVDPIYLKRQEGAKA